ncbi:MAG: GIY-YIG nuclease family protein [Deltaproteobacteria bacterium]|nr:GIY-YIG nuclease family protein [Deltaproteobacteria bacterium]MBW2659198.1 GIY-YIG nuclease family protein [Deltaproteobacteria bacterium]
MDSTTESRHSWYVYIVQCRDNTLYTGITTDLERRLREHNSSRLGARYTRPRRPVKLAYYEKAESRSSAASREYRIKQLKPANKKQLIAEFNAKNSP